MHYTATVETRLSTEEAFGYMADLSNSSDWDPSIKSALAHGNPLEQGAEFDVMLSTPMGQRILRYETIEFEAPRRAVLLADQRLTRSRDTVTVEERPSGSAVTYEATLELKGPLGLLGPLLQPLFTVYSRRAHQGLRREIGTPAD